MEVTAPVPVRDFPRSLAVKWVRSYLLCLIDQGGLEISLISCSQRAGVFPSLVTHDSVLPVTLPLPLWPLLSLIQLLLSSEGCRVAICCPSDPKDQGRQLTLHLYTVRQNENRTVRFILEPGVYAERQTVLSSITL